MAKGDGNQQLGDYIRSRRLSIGLSLADAAEASDLDPSYWNKLENGHYQNPAPQHLSTIAEALGVPVEDLYGLVGYDVPERLPTFQPYLRAKYNLPPEAIPHSGTLLRVPPQLLRHPEGQARVPAKARRGASEGGHHEPGRHRNLARLRPDPTTDQGRSYEDRRVTGSTLPRVSRHKRRACARACHRRLAESPG